MGDLIKESMGDNSVFKSRTAIISCSREEFYNFITDIRNFGEFVTSDFVKEWDANTEECSMQISPVGKVRISIAGKEPYSLVTYKGDALQKNEFIIDAHINEHTDSQAEVKLVVRAELNPILRMMAAGPIERFLETIADEMEKYNGWSRNN